MSNKFRESRCNGEFRNLAVSVFFHTQIQVQNDLVQDLIDVFQNKNKDHFFKLNLQNLQIKLQTTYTLMNVILILFAIFHYSFFKFSSSFLATVLSHFFTFRSFNKRNAKNHKMFKSLVQLSILMVHQKMKIFHLKL